MGVCPDVRRTSTTYDALDRRLKVRNYTQSSGGSVVDELQYEYDKFGVIKKYYQERSGAVNTGTSPKVTYGYDFPTDGTTGLRRTSTTYPSGEIISDEYKSGTDDTLSRLSGRKNGSVWVFEDSYLGMSRLVEREYGGLGVKWQLTKFFPGDYGHYNGIDNFSRLKWIFVSDGTAGGEINDYSYAYNYNSQITDLTNGLDLPFDPWDESFEYDSYGRLTEHWRNEEGPYYTWHECWTYDESGNATQFYGGSSATCDWIYIDHNLSNEIEECDEVPHGHSDAGEMTDRGTNCDQKFDAWNRMCEVQVDYSTVATYAYDGLGRKMKRTDSPEQEDTYYFYSPEGQVLEELKVSTGDRIHSYVWGTQNIDDIVMRIGAAANSEEYYVLAANNNVISRLDYQGDVFERYVYDGYGMPMALTDDWAGYILTEDLFLFTGRQLHVDHGQYDFRTRWQDPELGVWVTRDPIGIWGDPGNFGNGYAYVGGDPVNRTDPWGLMDFQMNDIPAGLDVRLDAFEPGAVLRCEPGEAQEVEFVGPLLPPAQPQVQARQAALPVVPLVQVAVELAPAAAGACTAILALIFDDPWVDDDDPAPPPLTRDICRDLLDQCLENPWQPKWNRGLYGVRKDCGACFRFCVREKYWPDDKCPLEDIEPKGGD